MYLYLTHSKIPGSWIHVKEGIIGLTIAIVIDCYITSDTCETEGVIKKSLLDQRLFGSQAEVLTSI